MVSSIKTALLQLAGKDLPCSLWDGPPNPSHCFGIKYNADLPTDIGIRCLQHSKHLNCLESCG